MQFLLLLELVLNMLTLVLTRCLSNTKIIVMESCNLNLLISINLEACMFLSLIMMKKRKMMILKEEEEDEII